MARLVKLIAAVLIFLYLVLQLLSFGFQGKPRLRAPERWVVLVTSPIQKGVTRGIRWCGDVVNHYFALSRTAKENERLRAEQDILRSQGVRLSELEAENRRLRELLELEKEQKLLVLGAELVAKGVSPYERTARISRGKKDGLAPGMAVLHPKGVVGQVIEVLEDRSDVLLLTDQASGIDVFDQRSRVRGILRGSRYDELRFEYVPNTEDLQVGDEIVTSGLDGVYPKGIPVGVVSSVKKGKAQLFLSAAVKPHVDVSRLEEVAVVLRAERAGTP